MCFFSIKDMNLLSVTKGEKQINLLKVSNKKFKNLAWLNTASSN